MVYCVGQRLAPNTQNDKNHDEAVVKELFSFEVNVKSEGEPHTL